MLFQHKFKVKSMFGQIQSQKPWQKNKVDGAVDRHVSVRNTDGTGCRTCTDEGQKAERRRSSNSQEWTSQQNCIRILGCPGRVLPNMSSLLLSVKPSHFEALTGELARKYTGISKVRMSSRKVSAISKEMENAWNGMGSWLKWNGTFNFLVIFVF